MKTWRLAYTVIIGGSVFIRRRFIPPNGRSGTTRGRVRGRIYCPIPQMGE